MQADIPKSDAFERAISYFGRTYNTYDGSAGAKEVLALVKDTPHRDGVAELFLSIGSPPASGHVQNSQLLSFAATTIRLAARKEHDIGQYVSAMKGFQPGDFCSFRTMLEVVKLPPEQHSYVMEAVPQHAGFLGDDVYHRWPFYVKEKQEEGRRVFGYREHELFQPLLTAVSEINFWGVNRLWLPEPRDEPLPDTSVVVDFFEHYSGKPYTKGFLSLFSDTNYAYSADAVKALMAPEVERLLDKAGQAHGRSPVAYSLLHTARLGMDIKPIAVSLEEIANTPFVGSVAFQVYDEAKSKGTTEATLKAFESPVVRAALQEFDSHAGRWDFLRGDLAAYLGYAARLGYGQQSIDEMAFRLAAVSGIASDFLSDYSTGPQAVHRLAESVLPRWGEPVPHEKLDWLAVKLHTDTLKSKKKAASEHSRCRLLRLVGVN